MFLGASQVIELTIYGDDLEDTQSLSDTDTDIASEVCHVYLIC